MARGGQKAGRGSSTSDGSPAGSGRPPAAAVNTSPLPAARNTRRAAKLAAEIAAKLMPPPPSPSAARNLRAANPEPEDPKDPVQLARRGTSREAREQSIGSIRSLAADTQATVPDSQMLQAVDEGEESDDGEGSDEGDNDAATDASLGLHPSVVGTPKNKASAVDPDALQLTPSRKLANATALVRRLPRLLTASDDLQEHLFSDTKDEDDTVWRVEHDAYKAAFDAYRSQFAGKEEFFIDLNQVCLQQLGFQGDLTDFHRYISAPTFVEMSRVTAAANIASLLEALEARSVDFLVFLEAVDEQLPLGFTHVAIDGTPDWAIEDGNIDLCLDVRTQRAIAAIKKTSIKKLDQLRQLAYVFCKDPQLADSMDETKASVFILDGPHRTLAGHEPLDNLMTKQPFVERLTAIRFIVNRHGPGAAAELDERWPANQFIDRLTIWARSQFLYLKEWDSIQASKTAGLPIEGQASEQSSQNMFVDAQEQPGPETQVAEMQPSALPPNYAPSEDHRMPTQEETDELLALEALDEEEAPPPNQEAQHVLPGGRLHSKSTKRLRELVQADEDEDEEEEEEEEEDGEDGAYETDNRVPSSQRRAALSPPPLKGRPAQKRPRLDQRRRPQMAFQSTFRASSGKQQGGRLPSSNQPSIPASSLASSSSNRTPQLPIPPADLPHPDLAALSQRSRQITFVVRDPKPPQRRVPWSERDVGLLIWAVGAYGAKWSTIERGGREGAINFDYQRDQQAIRDKARLQKVEFLKADGFLPPGFDSVVLGKKERQQVIDARKNPDRKEKDIDPDGNPVNTEYEEDAFA